MEFTRMHRHHKLTLAIVGRLLADAVLIALVLAVICAFGIYAAPVLAALFGE